MFIFSALSRCIHRRRLSEINRCNWRIEYLLDFLAQRSKQDLRRITVKCNLPNVDLMVP